MEQEEYTKDGIDWSYIDFVDNQDVLDLIEKVDLHIKHLLLYCIIVFFYDILIIYIFHYDDSVKEKLIPFC